jgi:hypothetical protein
MVALAFLTLAASFASFVAADLQITQPSAQLWWGKLPVLLSFSYLHVLVAASVNTLTWTCQDSSFQNFTILYVSLRSRLCPYSKPLPSGLPTLYVQSVIRLEAQNLTFVQNPAVLVAPQAILAIQQNADCSKLITQEQSAQTPATGYSILLANPLNSTDVSVPIRHL